MKKATGKNRREEKRKSGYTLVELIVVIAILLILAGGVAFGAAQWVRRSHFIRLNEYAQTLFVMAQKQLVDYDAGGSLASMAEELELQAGNSKLSYPNLTGLTDNSGNPYDLNTVWKYEDIRLQGKVARIVMKKSDYAYENYLSNPENMDPVSRIFYDLFSGYIYDSSVLNADICIEFEPKEGQVFAVLYCDANGSLDRCLNNRKASHRYQNMVGYYGVDTLSKASSAVVEKPSIRRLMLNNEETLNLSFEVKNASYNALTYTIEVYNKADKKRLFTIVVPGGEIRGSEDPAPVECIVTPEGDGEKTLSLMMWSESGEGSDPRIRIVLDGVDLQASSALYENSKKVGAEEVTKNKLANTFSFHRFGVEPEDIYCTVQASGTNYKTSAKKQSNAENTFFGSCSVSDKNDIKELTRTIKNGRHLYNMRYVEDLDLPGDEGTSESPSEQVTYRMTGDVDWKEMQDKNALFDTKMDGSGSFLDVPAEGEIAAFPSIRRLRATSVLESVEEHSYAIKNLHITKTENENRSVYKDAAPDTEKPTGLFLENEGVISAVTLKGLTVVGENMTGGFCGVNAGVLKNLTIESGTVSGTSCVGGFAGTIKEDLAAAPADRTAESGSDPGEKVLLLEVEGLTNRAQISGVSYVGGIFGKVYAENVSITVQDCKNYGSLTAKAPEDTDGSTPPEGTGENISETTPEVSGGAGLSGATSEELNGAGQSGNTPSEPAQKDFLYIGGIIGYTSKVNDAGTKNGVDLKITSCVSSPQYTDADRGEQLRNGRKGRKGRFVGGVIGYNYGGEVTYCNTAKESSAQEGYLFGDEYVGGVIGYNQIVDDAVVIDGATIDGGTGLNEIHVIGNRYVGGVVGCNASIKKDKDDEDEWKPDIDARHKPDCYTVTNWENRGVVIACDSYAGGIAGLSTGWINNCTAEVLNDTLYETLISLVKQADKFTGDYVGGIVGYNGGIIESKVPDTNHPDTNQSRPVELISRVYGRNFVGGVVGCNAVGATISDISVTGGYIRATGSFAGGYAGLNCSDSLLKGQLLKANPNEVSGEYCVGGVIGANIVDPGDDVSELKASFSTDNFLGSLRAGALAGGFCGYNRLVTVEETVGNPKETLRMLAEYMVESVLETGGDITTGQSDPLSQKDSLEGDEKKKLLDVLGNLQKLETNPNLPVKNNTGVLLTVSGSEENTPTQTKLGGLTAHVYVAGVIGYNAEDTRLKIANVQNITPVKALSAIEQSGLFSYAYPKDTNVFLFSWAGGMIGRVTKNTILFQCANAETGEVTLAGDSTFMGGLCEVNEGLIQECEISSVGAKTKDLVGGIAGLNAATGKIVNSSLSQATVTGGEYVGGVAALNYGLIDGISPENDNAALTITAVDSCVGGIVGSNVKKGLDWKTLTNDSSYEEEKSQGVIRLNGNTLNLKVQVTSDSGDCVGGVAGWNSGSIQTDEKNVLLDNKPQPDSSNLPFYVSGTVSGNRYVGGVVGLNAGGNLADLGNHASVTAEEGDAGGIMGGAVSLNADGAEQTAIYTISRCYNDGTISAKKGNAGGVTGTNHGEIKNCVNQGTVSAVNGICGGIAGENTGSLTDCEVSEVPGKGTITFIGSTYAGGICGRNARLTKEEEKEEEENKPEGWQQKKPKLSNCTVKGVAVTNRAVNHRSFLGGVTGENGEGARILKCQVGESTANTVTITSQAIGSNSSVNAGGVAGINRGTISSSIPDDPAEIVPYNKIYANLGYAHQNNSYFGNLGGVAGKNEGTIEYCEFSGEVAGTANNPDLSPQYSPGRDTETNGAEICGTGGIAGVNAKTIENCSIVTAKITGLGDSGNIANIGGIAGVNTLGASITHVEFAPAGTENPGNCTYKASFGDAAKLPKVKGYGNKEDKKANIYVGTGDSKTAYAHTGAVAGLNSGSITEILWEKNTDGTYELTANASRVIVENYRGHVGGIVGYNRRSGILRRVATGSEWVVYAPQNAQDNGCGGIIGYQAGDSGLAYCVNRAAVEKSVAPSNGVGGMIGRLEVATGSSYLFSSCSNFGDIYGNARVGGMIGVWKYYGGTLSDCINYGNVTSKGDGASGMVGLFYLMTEQSGTVRMQRCVNHGTIDGANGSAGGMTAQASGSVLLELRECVNTGLISGNRQMIAGIVGGNAKISPQSKVIGCRNYGFARNGKQEEFGGILATGVTANITVKDCFGLAEVMYPIAKYNVSQTQIMDNYYLDSSMSSSDDTQGGSSEKVYIRSVTVDTHNASNSVQNHDYIWKIALQGGTGEAEYNAIKQDTNRAYIPGGCVNNGWTSDYIFIFSKPVQLSEIELYWNRQEQDRTAKYKIYYLTGGDYKLLEESKNKKINPAASEYEGFELNEDVMTAAIKITVEECKTNGGTGITCNACLIRANFTGKVNDKEVRIHNGEPGSIYNTYSSNEYTKTEVASDGTARTVTFVEKQAPPNNNKGFGTPVVEREKDGEPGKYWLETKEGKQLGLSGFSYSLVKKLNGEDATKEPKYTINNNIVSWYDNVRYQAWLLDNEFLIPVLTDGQGGGNVSTPAMPENLSCQPEEGEYRAKWDPVSNAYFYGYQLTYYDKDNNQLSVIEDTVYGTEAVIPISDINGTPVKNVKVCVNAGRMKVYYDSGKLKVERLNSDWVTKEIDIADRQKLPDPQYHLELVPSGNTLKYQVILENQEEYRTFVEAKNGLLADITIKVQPGNFTFSAVKGKSEPVWPGNGSTTNLSFSAWAEPEDKTKYVQSDKVLRESPAPSGAVYQSENIKMANVVLHSVTWPNDIGFHGTTADTLSYLVRIQYNIAQAFYMRSELVAVDEGLKIPVCMSSSELRVSDTTTDYIPVSLTLPSDFLSAYNKDTLQVRSYPSVMSNSIVYNGHQVSITVDGKEKTSLTREELKDLLEKKALYVTSDQQLTTVHTDIPLMGISISTSEDGQLAPGFVAELGADGTYTFYYNALLGLNNNEIPAMKNQVFTYTPATPTQESPPEIGLKYSSDETQLLAEWDCGDKYSPEAEYDYVLMGEIQDGEGVVLQTVQIDAGSCKSAEMNYIGANGQRGNGLSWSTSGWNYKELTFTVRRRGTVSSTGVTNSLPSKESRSIAGLNPQLTQITRPEVTLHRADDGKVEKDDLKYDIIWTGVPKTEEGDLAGYEITVTLTSGNGSHEERAILPSGSNSPIEAFRDDKIEDPKNWSNWSPTSQLKVTLNLNDYEGSDTKAQVQVRALAKESASYRHGPAGVAREITLAKRLNLGSITVDGNPSFEKVPFVTMEQWNNGITLTATNTSPDSRQGRYQIAVAVYDQKEENSNRGEDPEENHLEPWAYGAEKQLIKKAEPQQMSGSLTNASIVLKDLLNTDYAGKWLKVVLRGVSDSAVSSIWSDEDVTRENDQQCWWIQLPRVQEETPKLAQGKTNVFYKEEGTDSSAIDVEQTMLSFELSKYAQQYEIRLIRSAESNKDLEEGEGKETTWYRACVDWIWLEQQDDLSYAVFYATSDPKMDEKKYEEEQKKNTSDWPEATCAQAENALYLGTLKEKSGLTLPGYTGDFKSGSDDSDAPVKTNCILRINSSDEGKQVVQLVLPDAERIEGGYENSDYLTTAQVSVQARLAKPEKSPAAGDTNPEAGTADGGSGTAVQLHERYEDSLIRNWYRKENGDGAFATLKKEEDAPQMKLTPEKVIASSDLPQTEINQNGIMTVTQGTSAKEDAIYQIRADGLSNWIVYEVELRKKNSNEDDQPLKYDYISAWGYGTSTVNTLAFLMKDEYGSHPEYKGAELWVRAASIITPDEQKGSLSAFGDWIQLSGSFTVPEEETEETEETEEGFTPFILEAVEEVTDETGTEGQTDETGQTEETTDETGDNSEELMTEETVPGSDELITETESSETTGDTETPGGGEVTGDTETPGGGEVTGDTEPSGADGTPDGSIVVEEIDVSATAETAGTGGDSPQTGGSTEGEILLETIQLESFAADDSAESGLPEETALPEEIALPEDSPYGELLLVE